MTEKFKGIFAALTTPFRRDEVAEDLFKDNIEKYNSFDLAGYVVGGSSGESVLLSDDECASLVKTAVQSAAPGKIVIAGTARQSTRHTIDFTNRAADLGAQAALIVFPHYYKNLMTGEALKTHYLAIAAKSKIPIIVYSIPQNTGILPSPDLFIELSQHPNILGVKDSSGILSFFAEVFPKMAAGSIYLLGAGSIIFPALTLGASGGILMLGAAAPDLCVRLHRLYLDGDWEAAARLQRALVPLNQAITGRYGIPAAKYVLDLKGWHGGEPRLPLLPLGDKVKAIMRGILEKLDSDPATGT
jgi:4-hydroxy-2-oxoglutarate aldolase